MTTLVLATRNRHKVAEIGAILGPAVRCLSLDALPGAPQLVEDRDSFAGNATAKAQQLADWLAGPGRGCLSPGEPARVLADDSGLEVDALGGAPGVRSARFAATSGEGNSTDTANNEKLLGLLRDVETARRTARFRCVLALVEVKQGTHEVRLFEGVCEGWIGREATGSGGFGYDPLFIPEGMDRTFAELGESEKNRISHRSRALSALTAAWDGA